MFLRSFRYLFIGPFLESTGNSFRRNTSTYSDVNFKNFKVTVCGASGGIGQPLSLMLKQSQIIQELALYDVKNTRGVAMDIGHVDTKCKVEAFTGHQELGDALADATIVLIAAGLPRKPGMSRNDLFTFNASVIQDIAEACLKYSPSAMIGVVTNPVNSTVPIACEVFRKGGIQNAGRIFGVTSLDVVRANTFVAEIAGVQPESVIVPVVGGHSATTIVPVLSQSRPAISLTEQQIKQLTVAIREAGSEVVKAKDGEGSATLSMAFAAARFTIALAKAALGEKNIIECAYVQSSVIKECDYLATPIELGPGGLIRNLGLPKLNDYEQSLLQTAIPYLQEDIKKGLNFVRGEEKPEVKMEDVCSQYLCTMEKQQSIQAEIPKLP